MVLSGLFSRQRVTAFLAVLALTVFGVMSAFAQVPTPEPFTEATYADAVNGSLSLIQQLGLAGFIIAAIILMRFAPKVFKMFTGGGR